MYGRFFRNSGGDGATLTCGISPSKQGYAAISDGYRKAVMAHKVATLHGENCVAYSDMGIYKLLVHIKDTSVLHEIYGETLGRRIKEILGCELNYEDKLRLMLSFFIKEFL